MDSGLFSFCCTWSRASDRSVICLDLKPSESPAAENRLPDLRVPVSVDTGLEKLSAAVAALRVLDVFRLVLLLAIDCGRSLRLRSPGRRSPSRGMADGVGREVDAGWDGSGEGFQFDRLNAAINLNAVGGGLSILVRV